ADFSEGPLAGKPAGILRMWGEGMGLVYSEEYSDGAHNKFIDIENKHGGISRIMLKSMPISSVIKDRIKGQAPSLFLFEELTNTYDPDYFIKVIQQLGRRKTVRAAAQQYIATCNPADEGEDHWVFQTFFLPSDTESQEDHDKKFGVHHVRMSENEWMGDKEAYLDRVMQEAKYDPTAKDRLIDGKWVKRIIGHGMFEGYWLPEIHVKGDIRKGAGLVPFAKELCTIGYDPGDVNNARVFMQRTFVDGSWRWRIFDEIINQQQRLSDVQLVKPILDKMSWWNSRMGEIIPWEHIADEQVMTHFNPAGSYIYREWAKISKNLISTNPRHKDLQVLYMKSPPKGAGSREERVRAVINKLVTEQIMVSATCPHVIEMFTMLKRAKDKFGNDELFLPLKTKHLHTFDALSYPIYYYDLQSRSNTTNSATKSPPQVIKVGD
ncbi:MAG: phage terminase large subunit, partial [Candidatus Thorarchaeota archaeon]